jgi:hypothetical protein
VTVATLVQSWTRTTERIDERAKTIKPRAAAFFLATIIPFLLAFLIYFVWKVVWGAITWLVSACVEGWNTAKMIDKKVP